MAHWWPFMNALKLSGPLVEIQCFCFRDCRTRWGCDDAGLGELGVGGPRGSSKLQRHGGMCSQRFLLSEGWVEDPDVGVCGWPLTHTSVCVSNQSTHPLCETAVIDSGPL